MAASSSSSVTRSSPPTLASLPGDEFLLQLEGKSGVYFVSNEYSDSQRFLVKVGTAHATVKAWQSAAKTGGLRTRLEQYLLYYPRGFSIYGLILTHASQAASVEGTIQSYLAGKQRKANFPHSRSEEWFWMYASEIESVIKLFGNKETTSLPVLNYYIFQPYYFLTKNPTAGKQRQVKVMTTPQRREYEATTSAVAIDTTQKNRKRPRSAQAEEPDQKLDIPKLSFDEE